jgi:Domain of unknown function (DUF2383)
MTNVSQRGSTTRFDKSIDLKVAMDDAVEGYEKMLEKAEPSFRPTVSELLAHHRAASQDIDTQLRTRGAAVDEDGSFMGAVHKTVVTLRAAVDDPDRDWIPGIVDGEKRNLKKYDEAITECAGDSTLQATLRRHRETLQRWVDALDAQRTTERKFG